MRWNIFEKPRLEPTPPPQPPQEEISALGPSEDLKQSPDISREQTKEKTGFYSWQLRKR